jgi:hypothetical protein
MVSARSRKSLCAEGTLTTTCVYTLSDGPSDVLSESDDDDKERYSDFEPEIAREIMKTVPFV